MLNSDLALIYDCKNGTKEINQAVKNNIEKFPERYCFKLTEKEYNFLRSKYLTANISPKSRYIPRAFTEQGVYMLATILKSKVASEITIAIMDAFVIMKKYISTNLLEQKYINNLVLEHDTKIDIILDKLSTKEEVIIIDNYAGKKLFDIIKDVKVKVSIYTKNIDELAKEKYEKQYSNLDVITMDMFHDRFILIDKKILYHSGASFKDIGSKCFAITKMEDDILIDDLISRLEII